MTKRGFSIILVCLAGGVFSVFLAVAFLERIAELENAEKIVGSADVGIAARKFDELVKRMEARTQKYESVGAAAIDRTLYKMSERISGKSIVELEVYLFQKAIDKARPENYREIAQYKYILWQLDPARADTLGELLASEIAMNYADQSECRQRVFKFIEDQPGLRLTRDEFSEEPSVEVAPNIKEPATIRLVDTWNLGFDPAQARLLVYPKFRVTLYGGVDPSLVLVGTSYLRIPIITIPLRMQLIKAKGGDGRVSEFVLRNVDTNYMHYSGETYNEDGIVADIAFIKRLASLDKIKLVGSEFHSKGVWDHKPSDALVDFARLVNVIEHWEEENCPNLIQDALPEEDSPHARRAYYYFNVLGLSPI